MPESGEGRAAHHVVAGQQLLQELGLLVHHCLDDELVIAGDVEQGAAGTRVGQLDQWLVAQRVLGGQGVGRWVADTPRAQRLVDNSGTGPCVSLLLQMKK